MRNHYRQGIPYDIGVSSYNVTPHPLQGCRRLVDGTALDSNDIKGLARVGCSGRGSLGAVDPWR